jgi:uncharacterized protein
MSHVGHERYLAPLRFLGCGVVLLDLPTAHEPPMGHGNLKFEISNLRSSAAPSRLDGSPLAVDHPGLMQRIRYREAIAHYVLANALPPDKFSHQPRLYHLARKLAEGRSFDDDVLYAAAWLHDLGVFIGHRPEDPVALAAWDALAYASQKVPQVLRQVDFPAGKIPAVLEAIRTHLPHGKPATFEGQLLRDADLLEQLGAIGILRTVSKVGRHTRFIRFSDALQVLSRNAAELPRQLQLESARREAQKRMALLRAFLESAEVERDGITW